MKIRLLAAFGLMMGSAMVFGISDAEAQGRGNSDRDRDRPTLDRRDDRDDRDDDRRYDRYEDIYYESERGNGAGKVPPGWCQGRGNPHNTVENCGYGAQSVYGDRNSRMGSASDPSYQRSHEGFHDMLDRKYRDLMAQRPLDIEYQLRLQVQKREEHDRWHRSMGVSHD